MPDDVFPEEFGYLGCVGAGKGSDFDPPGEVLSGNDEVKVSSAWRHMDDIKGHLDLHDCDPGRK